MHRNIFHAAENEETNRISPFPPVKSSRRNGEEPIKLNRPLKSPKSQRKNMIDFLQLSDKNFLVFGVANRKSVAYHIARLIEECGGRVFYVVRSEKRKTEIAKLIGDAPVFVCDVEHEEQIE